MHWKFAGQSPLIYDLLFVLFVMSNNYHECGQIERTLGRFYLRIW